MKSLGSKFLLSLALTAAAPGFAAVEQDLAVLLGRPDAARTFDYCRWRFAAGGTKESLPDFPAILAEDRLPKNEVAAAILLQAGTTVALAAENRKVCDRILRDGRKEHAAALEKAAKKMRSKASMRFAQDPEIAAEQRSLADLWVRDQAARSVYIESQTEDVAGLPFWLRRLATAVTTEADAASTTYLEGLLERVDWVDSHRFGSETSNRAWLLAQHADSRPDLQQRALERMAKYLEGGGVSRRNYAYLWDRVAVNHGELQRYGTQPNWTCKADKSLDLQPMEDPAHVDERRAPMGLGPAQADLEAMARLVCR